MPKDYPKLRNFEYFKGYFRLQPCQCSSCQTKIWLPISNGPNSQKKFHLANRPKGPIYLYLSSNYLLTFPMKLAFMKLQDGDLEGQ